MSLDQVARAAFAGVLNSLWVALAMAAAAWELGRLLPRTNAATRHLLWWSVLVLVLMLPLGAIDRTTRRPIPAAPIRAIAVVDLPTAPVVYKPVPAPRPAMFPLRLPGGKWIRVAIVLWALSVLLQLCRIAWSFGHLRAVKRDSLPAPDAIRRTFGFWAEACDVRRPVQILVSSRVASPIATGFRSPAVILPESLLPHLQGFELDHVLLHELAHVARYDDWTNLAARVLTALVGFHPVAAWVLQQAEKERELACDDWVVSMTGEARPYAASLAKLFELCGTRHGTLLAAGMAGSASHLGQRIETLLHRGRRFTRGASPIRVAVATIALLLFVAAGTRAPRWVVLAQAPKAPAPVSSRPLRPVNSHGSFLAALVAAGYGDLSVEQIIFLKERGVTAGFLEGVSQSGWGHMSVEELVDLVNHGVSPAYLREVRNAGFQHPTVQDVIAMHQNGVRPGTMADIHDLGFGPYSPVEAINLARHGVSPELFRAARDAGIKKIDANEAIDAFSRGVRTATFRAAGDYSSHLTLQQIVRLKQAGVLP